MNEHAQPLQQQPPQEPPEAREQEQAHQLGAQGPQRPSPQPTAPEQTTGDAAIDAALHDLETAPADDLDAQAEAGRRLHEALQGRLSDLGE